MDDVSTKMELEDAMCKLRDRAHEVARHCRSLRSDLMKLSDDVIGLDKYKANHLDGMAQGAAQLVDYVAETLEVMRLGVYTSPASLYSVKGEKQPTS